MPALAIQVQHNLAVGQVTVATLPQGTVIQWMALRRDGPTVVRNLRWDGNAPLEGFSFTVDDLKQTYHFFVPAICGNVSFIRSEPSLEAARLAEVARADAARAAAAAEAAAARLEAERAAAEQARLAAEQAAAGRASAAPGGVGGRREGAARGRTGSGGLSGGAGAGPASPSVRRRILWQATAPV